MLYEYDQDFEFAILKLALSIDKTIAIRDSFIFVKLRIGEVSRKYKFREHLLACSYAFLRFIQVIVSSLIIESFIRHTNVE